MESLLASDPTIIQETCIWMRVWYKEDVDLLPRPSRVAISTMTVDLVELYRKVLPPGKPIPGGERPFQVDDSIPEYKEITWTVRRLCLNHLGVLSVIISEHLRQ